MLFTLWPLLSRKRVVWGAFLIVFLSTFIFLEISSFSRTVQPIRCNDTRVFERVSQKSLVSKAFYSGNRPFFTPLVYKLAKKDVGKIRWIQSAASIICWFVFSVVLAREIGNPLLKSFAVTAPCLLSLTIPINQWDGILLSESFSISLLVSVVGLSIAIFRRIRERKKSGADWALLGIWALFCFLLIGTRDSCVYILWILALFLVLWGALGILNSLLKKEKSGNLMQTHGMLFVAVVLLAPIILFGSWSLKSSSRWKTPLTNVILARILTDDPVYQSWVSKYGFPDRELFRRQRGKMSWSPIKKGRSIREEIKREDSPLHDIYGWISHEGFSTYKKHLVRDQLPSAVDAAMRAFFTEINATNETYGKGISGVKPWTQALTSVLYPPIDAPVLMFLLMSIWAFFSLLIRRQASLLPLTVILMLTFAASQAFVCFHGDAAEVSRHMVGSVILYRIALVVFLIGVAADLIRTGIALKAHLKKR